MDLPMFPPSDRSQARIPLIMAMSLVAIAYGLLEREGPAPDVVVVVNGQPLTAEAVLDSVRGEPPNPVTSRWVDAAIEHAVVDELLFQRAHELGLDRRDAVLRGRVMQILREVAEEEAALEPVTESEVRAHYDEDPSRFSTNASVRFEEIYVQGASDVVPERLTKAREKVLAGGVFDALKTEVGDPPPFEFPQTERTPIHVIRRRYGEAVAQALLDAPLKTLSAPIRGPSGYHIFRVLEREDPRPRPFQEVRALLEADLRERRRRRAVVDWTQRLREEALVERASGATERLRRALDR